MPTFLEAPQPQVLMQAIAGLPSMSASDLKNNFGSARLQALKGAIAITHHNRAEFVLLTIGHYAELQRAQTAPLDALAGQLDALVAKMATPAAKRGVAKLFKASPTSLGKTAVRAARAAHGG